MSAQLATANPVSSPLAPSAIAGGMLSVIVPVYNEARYIREVIERLQALPIPHEIIVVDDCSTDGTADILRTLPESVRVITHPTNVGKGMAIQSAIPYLRGAAVVVQDADLEYHPQELVALFMALEREGAHAVFGSRFSGTIVGMRPEALAANRFLTCLTNWLYGASLTDLETCYKVIRTDVIKQISLQSKGFEIDPEMTAKLLRLGCRIHEMPISYAARSVRAGKKIRWTDACVAMATLFKYRWWRLRSGQHHG